jgi:hypothetical protein
MLLTFLWHNLKKSKLRTWFLLQLLSYLIFSIFDLVFTSSDVRLNFSICDSVFTSTAVRFNLVICDLVFTSIAVQLKFSICDSVFTSTAVRLFDCCNFNCCPT